MANTPTFQRVEIHGITYVIMTVTGFGTDGDISDTFDIEVTGWRKLLSRVMGVVSRTAGSTDTVSVKVQARPKGGVWEDIIDMTSSTGNTAFTGSSLATKIYSQVRINTVTVGTTTIQNELTATVHLASE